MKIKKPAVVLLVAFVSFFGLSQTASAALCTAEVTALKAALNDDMCHYSRKCKGLSHKLDNVNRKLNKGKFRRAARKLANFGDVVENMAMRKKPKISMDDYAALINPYFNDAANCIANRGVVVNDNPDTTPDDVETPDIPDENPDIPDGIAF